MNESPMSFVQRQLNAVDSLVLLMMGRLTEHFPMVEDLSPELKGEMVDWLRRLATAALERVIKGESLDALGPMIEQMARRRQAQGIEHAHTLKAYEVAQQALLDSLSQQLRGHPQEAYLFPQLTRRLLEFQRVSTLGVTAGYASSPEPYRRDRIAEVQALLEIRAGRRTATSGDHDVARRLGLSLPLKVLTVSVELGAEIEDMVRRTGRMNPWGVVGILDGRVVALTLRTPHAFPDPSGTARLPDVAGPEAVQAAITAAGKAADVAVVLGHDQLAATDAAPLAAMLTLPAEARAAYVEGCFRSLPASPRGLSLLAAVSAALTYGRPGEAARALHVHRHTLDYRLGRFAAETGLDLNDPATRFRCAVGLFLIGLMPPPVAKAG
jgi:hypothetical protein